MRTTCNYERETRRRGAKAKANVMETRNRERDQPRYLPTYLITSLFSLIFLLFLVYTKHGLMGFDGPSKWDRIASDWKDYERKENRGFLSSIYISHLLNEMLNFMVH